MKAALYYVRLDTHNNHALFEGTEATTMSFSQIAADELLAAAKRKDVTLDHWAVAPDAIHALVSITENCLDQDYGVGKPRLLTSFVAGVKAATAKRINLVRNQPGSPVWQRSYREQRIEDDRTLARLTEKIKMASSVRVSG